MTHTSTYYYIQSMIDGKEPEIIGHSKNKETGEVYYKMLSRKQALNLMKDERKVSPEYKYRVVKETQSFSEGEWL